jgi:hypothetical protein
LLLSALSSERSKKRPKGRGNFSPLFEIASVLVRFDHGTGFIVNADDGIMWPTVESRVVHRVIDCVWLTVPQRTKWQRIGN